MNTDLAFRAGRLRLIARCFVQHVTTADGREHSVLRLYLRFLSMSLNLHLWFR